MLAGRWRRWRGVCASRRIGRGLVVVPVLGVVRQVLVGVLGVEQQYVM